MRSLFTLLERDVLGLDRLRGLAQLLRRALGVAKVGLLRLAHQQQRQREDDERPDADRLVRLVDDGGDEAVDEVVERQPAEALAPGAPRVLAALDGDGEREQAGVDGKVGEAGDQPHDDEHGLRAGAADVHREDLRGGERGKRERADVEEQLVEDAPPGAPLDRRHRDRERERGARADDRSAGERTDGAHRDRAGVLDLERESLADADEDDDRDQACDVGARTDEDAADAHRGADDSYEADQHREAPRHPEEVRGGRCMRPNGPSGARASGIISARAEACGLARSVAPAA